MAPSVERVFAEAALGVLAAMDAQGTNTSRVQHGEWTAMLNANEGGTGLDHLLLAWLDEVLYQAQTKSRWMLSADVHITQDQQGARLRAMVAYVSADDMVRGVEVKPSAAMNSRCRPFRQAKRSQEGMRTCQASLDPRGMRTSSWMSEVGAPRVDARPHGPNPLASSVPGPHSTHGPR